MDIQHREHSMQNDYIFGWIFIQELNFFTILRKTINESYIIEPLTWLINRPFNEGIFPTELKLVRVVTIFKLGDSIVLSNY